MDREAVGRRMEILLVEDNLEDAGLTIDTLKCDNLPCRVSLVCDGEEALEFLYRQGRYGRTPQPDLILLDMNLPKRDGREVLAEIRKDSRLQAIPVMVLTSSTIHEDILRNEGLQVQSYLTKPVDIEAFIATVRKLRKFLLADVILPP